MCYDVFSNYKTTIALHYQRTGCPSQSRRIDSHNALPTDQNRSRSFNLLARKSTSIYRITGRAPYQLYYGKIVKARDYCEFLRYQQNNTAITGFERDKAWKNRNPAIKCGYALRPSDTVTDGYCPECEVNMCLIFLDAIIKVFQQCAGPRQQRRMLYDYPLVRRCWHSARRQLTRGRPSPRNLHLIRGNVGEEVRKIYRSRLDNEQRDKSDAES